MKNYVLMATTVGNRFISWNASARTVEILFTKKELREELEKAWEVKQQSVQIGSQHAVQCCADWCCDPAEHMLEIINGALGGRGMALQMSKVAWHLLFSQRRTGWLVPAA